MAYGLYDGSLKSIPGLGGYLQQTELNQQGDARNLQSGMQLMTMIKEQKAQQDDAAVRQVLSQGGDPGKVIQSLLKVGSPQAVQMAQHVMTINQAQQSLDAMKGLNLTDPDAMRRAAMGNPTHAGPLLAMADKIQQRQADTAEHAAQVSTPTPITEAPTVGYQARNGQQPALAERANSVSGVMVPKGTRFPGTTQETAEDLPKDIFDRMVAAAGGQDKPIAISDRPSTNPAENTQNTGGLFSQFYNSPISVIPKSAAASQVALDSSNPLAIAPKSWNDKATAMGTREASLAQAQALAGMRNDTANRRIDVGADNGEANRNANRENILLRQGVNPDGTLSANGEARARLIASGKMSATAQDRGVMARVQQLNPNWSNADYQTNLANEKAFTSGKKGDTVRSFSVTIDHLHTLKDLADALDNNDVQAFNRFGNYIATQTGKPAPTDFNAAKALVADEIVKAVVGASGALGDRETAQATLNAANSPAQIAGVIDTYERLMSGQLRGLHQQYTSSGGTKDFNSFLSDEAKAAADAHPAPGTAPEVKGSGPMKQIGGKTYIKVNGKWYEQ